MVAIVIVKEILKCHEDTRHFGERFWYHGILNAHLKKLISMRPNKIFKPVGYGKQKQNKQTGQEMEMVGTGKPNLNLSIVNFTFSICETIIHVYK